MLQVSQRQKTHSILDVAIRSIDEGFADLVCTCDLQWELCDVLTRSVRRHQADAMRMPFERLQLGCEILLYVFSKLERMRYMIRDHLYHLSR